MWRNSAVLVALLLVAGCDQRVAREPQSASGISKTSVQLPTNPEGLTVEQKNVRDRLLVDNKPGAIKHLYVVSPYSGQVIIYSTVRGKVTSGGKRLTPSVVTSIDGEYIGNSYGGFDVAIGNQWRRTPQVLGDDGTYGESGDYLFWWDAKGVYHQHYLTGGQIVHVSEQPLAVKSVIINMETAATP